MSRYVITQSQISSWAYCHSCGPDYAEEAVSDFEALLRKEPRETSPAALNGIEFEDAVYDIVKGVPRTHTHPKWESGIQAVATIIKGSQLQVKGSRPLTCCGMDFLVYGKLDALRAGVIRDVKFSNKGFSSAELQGKYLESPQHPLYMYIWPDAYKFEYVVSDGTDVYVETYTRDQTRDAKDVISEFIRGISDMGLLETYKKYQQAYE